MNKTKTTSNKKKARRATSGRMLLRTSPPHSAGPFFKFVLCNQEKKARHQTTSRVQPRSPPISRRSSSPFTCGIRLGKAHKHLQAQPKASPQSRRRSSRRDTCGTRTPRQSGSWSPAAGAYCGAEERKRRLSTRTAAQWGESRCIKPVMTGRSLRQGEAQKTLKFGHSVPPPTCPIFLKSPWALHHHPPCPPRSPCPSPPLPSWPAGCARN